WSTSPPVAARRCQPFSSPSAHREITRAFNAEDAEVAQRYAEVRRGTQRDSSGNRRGGRVAARPTVDKDHASLMSRPVRSSANETSVVDAWHRGRVPDH